MAKSLTLGSRGAPGLLSFDKPSPSATGNALGLLSAGIMDLGAALSGRPGNVGNLSAFSDERRMQEAQQRFAEALNSPDPATRQKAYEYAAMNDIDTSKFEARQAASAMPKLLDYMRPRTEAVPEIVSEIPKSIVSLPGGRSMEVGGGKISSGSPVADIPGLSLSEALGKVGSPELSAQMAPQIIKQQLEDESKRVRPLSAQEKKAMGFSENLPVFANAYGEVTVKADPTVMTPYQQRMIELQTKRVNEMIRNNNQKSGAGGVPGLGAGWTIQGS